MNDLRSALAHLLAPPGRSMPARHTADCPTLNDYVEARWGLNNYQAADIAWTLVEKAVLDNRHITDGPLHAARMLLALGDDLPRTMDDLVPGTDLTFSEACRRAHTDVSKQHQPDFRLAGHRQALAAATHPLWKNRTLWRATAPGALDAATGLLTALEKLLKDSDLRADLIEQWKAEHPRLIDPQPNHPVAQSERDSTADAATPQDAATPVDAQPVARSESWQRLHRLSRLLASDLDSGAQRDDRLLGLSAGLYVRRNREEDLLKELMDPRAAARLVIRAEAGHGKSSLLWSLHRALVGAERNWVEPLLVSSAWLLSGGTGAPVLSTTDILEVTQEIQAVGRKPIVLLDTADLLLHDDELELQTRLMLETLSDHDVAWIIASRPREVSNLNLDDARFVNLGPYEDNERDEAVVALAGALCPDVPHGPLVESIRSTIARGQPVADVCRSPLLLRLLFELYAPNEPSLEIDANGLYERFWQRRVRADLRTGASTRTSRRDDLGALAGAIAVVMLAAGTPDCAISVLEKTVPDVLRSLAPDLPITYADGLESLARRGVIHLSNGRARFLHQTMFEYASAQALYLRGRADDLALLCARVLANPYDLLTGAVLEYLLLVTGKDPLATKASAETMAQLLATDEIALHQIGLTALAHHPELLPDHDRVIEALPLTSVRHLASVLPTIRHQDDSEMMELFASLWQIDDSSLRLTVIEALARIAHRLPSEAIDFARRYAVCAYAIEHKPMSPAAQRTLPRLFTRTADVDPAFARTSLQALLVSALSSGEGRVIATSILEAMSEAWALLGGQDFLEMVIMTVSDAYARRDADSRRMRESLGRIYAAQWRLDGQSGSLEQWRAVIATTLKSLTSNEQTIPAGAALVGLIYTITSLDEADPRIDECLDALFSLDIEGAVRQLQRSALPIALSSESPAGTAIAARLRKALAGFLNPAGSAEDRRIAEVARETLTDERVISRYFVASLPDVLATNVEAWLDRHGVVVLLARAHDTGIRAAAEAFERVVTTPDIVDPDARKLLLDGCVRRVKSNPELTGPTVRLAVNLNRVSAVQALCTRGETTERLRPFAADLRAMIGRNLTGLPEEQAAGARLWGDLVAAHVLPLNVDDVAAAIGRTTHPEAVATLIRVTCINAANQSMTQIQSGIALCQRYLDVSPADSTQILQPSRGNRRPARPVVLDACRDTWLALAAFHPSSEPSQWPLVKALTVAPRLHGKREPDLTGFGNCSHFLSALATHGYTTQAATALTEFLDALQAGGFSAKQIRTGTHKLRPAVRAVLTTAAPDSLTRLLDWLPGQQPVVGALVARAIIQLAPMSAQQQLLDTPGLQAEVRRQVRIELRKREHPAKTGAFPEILAPGEPRTPNL